MRLREHPGVKGKRDFYPFDPRLLKVDPDYNVRDLTTKDARVKLDELKEQIRHAGVRTPLEVRMQGDDLYIVAGHRRHWAVMELIAEGVEIESIPVIHEPLGTNDAERAINLVLSNSGEPLTPLELARVVKRLADFGWDESQIAKRIGWKSKASVRQHLDMLALPEEVQQAVKRGEVSATMARRLEAENPGKAAQLIKEAADEQKRLGKAGRATPKAVSKVAPARPRKTKTDAGQEPSAAQAAAFSNGNAGTSESEYTAPQTRDPLPTDAEEVAAPEGPQPEATPPVLVGDPQVAPAAEPTSQEPPAETVSPAETRPLPGPMLTNGVFFRAAEPIAAAIAEQVELSEFEDDDMVGIQIRAGDAKVFSSTVNQARGTS